MVGGANGVGEKGVASEEIGFGIKTNGTGGMTGSRNDLNDFFVEFNFFGKWKSGWLFQGFGGRPVIGRFGGILIQKIIFGMQIDRKIKVKFEFKTAETVIKMTVSEKNRLGVEPETENFFGDKVGVVAGIDDETV